jgi:Dual-action HEIGH metallo-peptidase
MTVRKIETRFTIFDCLLINLFTLNQKIMKKMFSLMSLAVLFAVAISCQDQEPMAKNGIPQDVINQLQAAGFDTSEGLTAHADGYRVEYDIYLTRGQIASLGKQVSAGQHGAEEHYRTTNLVTSPRTIKVWMDPGFGGAIYNEFLASLGRYNSQNLTLTFQAETTQNLADIQIIAFYENSNTLGQSAGFPTSAGSPASPIKLNTKYYNSTAVRTDTKTVITHEIGHAIGFRHTDYMNRKYSCGPGPFNNEGSSGVGALHIPGTPTGPDAKSWMLACSNNTDRPFTANDVTALTNVY